jgi:probable addiction module antidote protein
MNNKLTKNHQDSLLETLKNPKEAAAYLNAALEEGDNELFLLAVRNVIEASENKNISKQPQLNSQDLYKTISNKENPELTSLRTILGAIGLKISINPTT